MEVTVKNLRKPAIVYKIAPSGNSGHKIVSVHDKCYKVLATKMLSWGFVLFQSTFHLVIYVFGIVFLPIYNLL